MVKNADDDKCLHQSIRATESPTVGLIEQAILGGRSALTVDFCL